MPSCLIILRYVFFFFCSYLSENHTERSCSFLALYWLDISLPIVLIKFLSNVLIWLRFSDIILWGFSLFSRYSFVLINRFQMIHAFPLNWWFEQNEEKNFRLSFFYDSWPPACKDVDLFVFIRGLRHHPHSLVYYSASRLHRIKIFQRVKKFSLKCISSSFKKEIYFAEPGFILNYITVN